MVCGIWYTATRSVTTFAGSYLHGTKAFVDPDVSDAALSSVGIDFPSSSPESKSAHVVSAQHPPNVSAELSEMRLLIRDEIQRMVKEVSLK